MKKIGGNNIAKSLDEAARQVCERNRVYREAAAKLPEGLQVGIFTKTTIDGAVYWVSSKRGVYDLLPEVGQKKLDAALNMHGIQLGL